MSSFPPSSDPWSAGAPPPYQPGGGNGQPGNLASWGQRVAGSLIDGLIGSAVLIVGAVAGSVALIVVGYLFSIGFGIWNQVQQGNTGQTIGKRIMSIRLVRLDGVSPPGVGLSIGRWLLHIVDGAACGLGYLWPLWDEKRQTFSDKILNTVVVTA